METDRNSKSKLSRQQADRVLLLLGIIIFLNGLGSGVAFPILPLLGPVIGVSPFFISMIISSNRISRVIFNAGVGEMVDRYGCRGPLIIGLFLKALSVAGFVLSIHSPIFPGHLFFVFRFLYGIGSAFGFITVYAMMFHLTDKSNRGSRTAYIRTAGLFGLPTGLFLGGLISDYFGYDAAFLFSAASLFIFTLIAYKLIPKEIEASPRTAAVNPLKAIKLALTDSRVFRISLVNMMEWFSVQGVFLATTALYVEHHGINIFGLGAEGMSGFLMGVMMFTKGLSTLILGRYIDRSPTRTRYSIAGAILGGMAFFFWAIYPSMVMIIVGLLLLGTCSGIMSSPLLTLLGDVSRPELRGRTLGIYQIFGDMGGMLGPVFGVNMAEWLGFTPTYLAITVVMGVTLLVVISLNRTERSNSSTPASAKDRDEEMAR